MNDEYEAYLMGDDWKAIRDYLIDQRGLHCERCYKKCKRFELHVHHKNYDMELCFEREEDMMLVCKECHALLEQDLEFFEQVHIIKLHNEELAWNKKQEEVKA